MINNYEFFNDCIHIMSALKQFGATELVVAGGAIRDSLLGKPIKDIDVFYLGDLNIDDESPEAKELGIKWDTDDDEVDSFNYPGSNIEVTSVNLLFDNIPYPVQLIKVKGTSLADLGATVAGFPCGLSKAILWEDGSLSLGSDFLQSEYFKVVSYSPEAPAKYKDKMVAKFPEYAHE